jgi:outer membrane protein OmpA-like peptidoglycan-associated protein
MPDPDLAAATPEPDPAPMPDPDLAAATPEPDPAPMPDPDLAAATPEPDPAPVPDPDVVDQTPTTPDSADAFVAYDKGSDEHSELVAQVDVRIEEAPITLYNQREKDRVRTGIRNARKVGLAATVFFTVGGADLPAEEKERLAKTMATEEVSSLLGNPTTQVIILGMADPSGSTEGNIALSQVRADSVKDLLKEGPARRNVVHAVAIGETEIQSGSEASKNRAAEIWLVLP